uniref:ATP synthase complex subunit 8 n=1 Tax=Schultesia lampyridiformis TaxID=36965 RepID=A0A2P1H7Q8_SCHLA|nr:ATP synthase F0 subunit 8 [Schultesia lampyridiformis]
MPQMMPLSWLSLYMFFISILMLFVFMNYYSFIPTPDHKSKKLSQNLINWKW